MLIPSWSPVNLILFRSNCQRFSMVQPHWVLFTLSSSALSHTVCSYKSDYIEGKHNPGVLVGYPILLC